MSFVWPHLLFAATSSSRPCLGSSILPLHVPSPAWYLYIGVPAPQSPIVISASAVQGSKTQPQGNGLKRGPPVDFIAIEPETYPFARPRSSSSLVVFSFPTHSPTDPSCQVPGAPCNLNFWGASTTRPRLIRVARQTSDFFFALDLGLTARPI